MRNRVLITNSTYHVDEVNKVVVCTLECDMQLHKHPAASYLMSKMWQKKMPNVTWDGEFTVRAKARCNTVDTFNVETGKRIAESRAKAKMFRVVARVWELCSKELIKMATACSMSSVACIEAKKVEEGHIKKLEA